MVYTCVCVRVCIWMYIYICAYMYIYIYICIFTDIYIYVWSYVYIIQMCAMTRWHDSCRCVPWLDDTRITHPQNLRLPRTRTTPHLRYRARALQRSKHDLFKCVPWLDDMTHADVCHDMTPYLRDCARAPQHNTIHSDMHHDSDACHDSTTWLMQMCAMTRRHNSTREAMCTCAATQ